MPCPVLQAIALVSKGSSGRKQQQAHHIGALMQGNALLWCLLRTKVDRYLADIVCLLSSGANTLR